MQLKASDVAPSGAHPERFSRRVGISPFCRTWLWPGRDVHRIHYGAKWCILVYTCFMSAAEKPMRQSISLPSHLARRVRTLAKDNRTSTNRVLVELIESGIESQESEKIKFFELADRLSASSNPAERKRIKAELARMTFGK